MKKAITLMLFAALTVTATAQRKCRKAPAPRISISQYQNSGSLNRPDISSYLPDLSTADLYKSMKESMGTTPSSAGSRAKAVSSAKVNGYEITITSEDGGEEMLEAKNPKGKVIYKGPRSKAKNLPGPVKSILANMKIKTQAGSTKPDASDSASSSSSSPVEHKQVQKSSSSSSQSSSSKSYFFQ